MNDTCTHRSTSLTRRRGMARADLLAGALCATTLIAAALPVIGRPAIDSGEARSLSNLRTLAAAHEAYGQTFANKQWTAMPENAGLVGGNCNQYIASIACPPQQILGQAPNGAIWGYYLGGGLCSAQSFPGTCSNWATYKPIEFTGPSAAFGAFRLPNVVSFNAFVDGRFYSDRFYSPNDRIAYEVSARYRDVGVPFDSINGEMANSSYCLSPAAMSNVDVFAASYGGFRSPNSFVEGYVAPTVTQCVYPELKTRMIEFHWNLGAPGFKADGSASEAPGYRFNLSALASPNALFFDGRVGRISNAQAIDDDAAVRAAGGLGLWSRTTPFGEAGFPATTTGVAGPEGTTTSHTMLTIDGLLGRDLLTAK